MKNYFYITYNLDQPDEDGNYAKCFAHDISDACKESVFGKAIKSFCNAATAIEIEDKNYGIAPCILLQRTNKESELDYYASDDLYGAKKSNISTLVKDVIISTCIDTMIEAENNKDMNLHDTILYIMKIVYVSFNTIEINDLMISIISIDDDGNMIEALSKESLESDFLV